MKRDRQAGLTLIEMLVVLVIVAVMAGVAVLGLGSLDRGSRAEAEARRLADRLQLASDEVLVAGAPLAMLWDPGGYRFVRSRETVAAAVAACLTVRISGQRAPHPRARAAMQQGSWKASSSAISNEATRDNARRVGTQRA